MKREGEEERGRGKERERKKEGDSCKEPERYRDINMFCDI